MEPLQYSRVRFDGGAVTSREAVRNRYFNRLLPTPYFWNTAQPPKRSRTHTRLNTFPFSHWFQNMTSVTSQTKANCFKWHWKKPQRILPVQLYPYHRPVPWLTGASEWSLGIMAQSFLVTAFKHLSTVVYLNKNALTGAVSLACLEIRSRNEETVNSARNTIYSSKVFYFLLYRRRYFLFVSELI